jgi:hypothetical protein
MPSRKENFSTNLQKNSLINVLNPKLKNLLILSNIITEMDDDDEIFTIPDKEQRVLDITEYMSKKTGIKNFESV